MTDEEIITKAFNDNSCKYEDWKDCCEAMMRDAMEMKEKQIKEELKFDVDELTLGDVKFAIKHSPYYAEMVLRAMGESFMKTYRNVVSKNKGND